MPANSYHFVEHWTIPDATPEEVWRIIADARLLPRWWRGVYLSAEPLDDAPPCTAGARYRVRARGFLPYKLNFVLESLELEPERLVAVKAHGDFQGVWQATLAPQGAGTRVDIDWRVTGAQAADPLALAAAQTPLRRQPQLDHAPRRGGIAGVSGGAANAKT